jgi:PhnB protein
MFLASLPPEKETQCKSNPICSSKAAAAVEFYRKALGAEIIVLKRFKESPDPQMCQPGAGEKVLHMSFRVGDATLMASDGRCTGQANFQVVSLSLTTPNDSEAERLFGSLADGGQVQMPLTKTFFPRASAWSPTGSACHG